MAPSCHTRANANGGKGADLSRSPNPSGKVRFLREADNQSRRFASVRQALPEDMLEFMAGGLFGDLRPRRDSERGSLCTRRTTPPAEFREQGRGSATKAAIAVIRAANVLACPFGRFSRRKAHTRPEGVPRMLLTPALAISPSVSAGVVALASFSSAFDRY